MCFIQLSTSLNHLPVIMPHSSGLGCAVDIATGYGLDGPGIESRWGARFSAPVQTGPGAHSVSCTMGTGSFPGVKSGWGVTLNPHPLLVPWSGRGRAIRLLPLWAVRPVQSLSACTRVHFTFFYRATYLYEVGVLCSITNILAHMSCQLVHVFYTTQYFIESFTSHYAIQLYT